MLGIVISEADEASTHVREYLLALADWEETTDPSRPAGEGGGTLHRLPDAELRSFSGLHLELTDLASAFADPSLIAVASRHAGDTGPLLTAHHTGNFGPADFGGRDHALARAAPNAHRATVEALATHAPEGYDVGMECTHHGPTDVGAPSLFVEVGSGPEEWADPDAARAVAQAILDLRGVNADAPPENGSRRHLVGFGGGHYAPRFERIVRETDWAVGHVAADWALSELAALDEGFDDANVRSVIESAFAESVAGSALVADDRPALVETIEDLGYRVVGETWVRETSGVPLGLVGDLEDAIEPVEKGLRFGTAAREYADDFVVGTVPTDLHEEATGIDREATLAGVDSIALAYDTEQGGSVFAGRVALADRADGDVLIAHLATLLARTYDDVSRAGEELVVTTAEFDPDLAREAGVEAGPDFGTLADGEPVTVDGETVEPADVTRTVERRFDATVTID